jgi:DNA-binding HxlR family transcriptional regulator
MPELPQRWAITVLAKLWKTYGEKLFTNEQARKTVQTTTLNQALSHLHQTGWLTMKRDNKDARKSVYALKQPSETFLLVLEEEAKQK